MCDYSYRNNQGYDVNAYGYDKNGIYRGRGTKIDDPNSFIGAIVLALFVLAIAILEKVAKFIEANWLFIVIFLGIFIIGEIIFFVSVKKARKKAYKILIVSFLVFFSIFNSFPMKKGEILNKIKELPFTQGKLQE